MDINSIFKKSAFTLVEVLITLALLGVISAMTIPTLTYNYRSKLLETQFKSTYRDLKEIGLYLDNQHGDVGEYSKVISLSNWAEEIVSFVSGGRDYNKTAGSGAENNIQTAIKELYKNGGKSPGVHLFGSDKSSTASILCDNGGIWTDSKGRIWTFNAENKIVCVDINGSALPNMYNVDIFAFIPMSASQVAQWVYDKNKSDANDYSGQMVLCDADALARSNNSNQVNCSDGPDKPGNISSSTSVSCALDLCPFNWPVENMAPRYTNNGSVAYPKNRLGQTVNAGDDYWKDYIQFK